MKLVIAFSAQEHVYTILLQVLLGNFFIAKIANFTSFIKIHLIVFLLFIIILVIWLYYHLGLLYNHETRVMILELL